MKKFQLLFFIVSSILFTIFIVSCDSEYDLSKETDLDMTIGKNFSIPIGKTDTIYLSRIISEGDNLTADAITGIYQLNANGEFSSEIAETEQFEIEGLEPHFVENVIEIPLNAIPGYQDWMWDQRKNIDIPQIKDTLNKTHYVKIQVNTKAEYDIETTKTELPSGIENIYSITFNGDGKLNANGHTGAESVIKIFIPKEFVETQVESFNGTSGIKEIHLEEVHIKFPDIFILKDEDKDEDKEENLHEISRHDIWLREDPDESKNLTAEIHVYIEGAEIPEELQDDYFITENDKRYFRIPEDANITLSVEKASLAVIPAELEGKNLLFDFKYEISATNVTNVNGKIKPDVNIDEELALNDLPDFIKDEESVFKPNDLTFKFSLDNPLGMELATSINITPYHNNGQISGTPVSINIKDETAIKPYKNNKYVISNKQREVKSDETLIVLESLPELISPIPDYYKITTGDVIADGKESTGLELGQSLNLSGTYDIEVPFSFEDLSISYTDEMDMAELQESLEGITELIQSISLEADFETTIPIGLEMQFKFYDSEDNELTGIQAEDIIIEPAGHDGKPTVSRIKLNLSVNKGNNELERLEKIVYTVKAANKVKNVSLSNKQYILLKNIVAKIPNGITVEL